MDARSESAEKDFLDALKRLFKSDGPKASVLFIPREIVRTVADTYGVSDDEAARLIGEMRI